MTSIADMKLTAVSDSKAPPTKTTKKVANKKYGKTGQKPAAKVTARKPPVAAPPSRKKAKATAPSMRISSHSDRVVPLMLRLTVEESKAFRADALKHKDKSITAAMRRRMGLPK